MWKLGLLAAAVLASACGYRFTARGGELPGGVRTAYVPMFQNRTPEAGAEALFTAAMRGELSRAGREGEAASDARLEGELVSLAGGQALFVTPPGLTGGGQVASYRLLATAKVRLVRAGQTLKEIAVSGQEDFLPGSTILEAEGNRRTALRRLAADLMRQAYESLSSGY